MPRCPRPSQKKTKKPPDLERFVSGPNGKGKSFLENAKNEKRHR